MKEQTEAGKGLAVVTGASGGLGFEFARCAARDGYELLLVAHEPGKLKSAAKQLHDDFEATVETVAVDLSQPEAVEAVMAAVGERPVAVLVNNAGFATYGRFASLGVPRELAEIRVNIEALTHLTRRVLPGMLHAKAGKIMNVASVAAFMPGPLMSTYYASKAYVLSFSQGLAQEVEGSGVAVTALCPGPTRTGFANRAHVEDTKLFRHRLMDAVRVANEGWQGMKAGKRVVVPGWRNWWEAHLVRIVPHKWLAKVIMQAQERVG